MMKGRLAMLAFTCAMPGHFRSYRQPFGLTGMRAGLVDRRNAQLFRLRPCAKNGFDADRLSWWLAPDGPMPFGMRLIGAISPATMPVFTWPVCAARLLRTGPMAPVLSAASLASSASTLHAASDALHRNEIVDPSDERTIPLLAASIPPLLFNFWFTICFTTASSAC